MQWTFGGEVFSTHTNHFKTQKTGKELEVQCLLQKNILHHSNIYIQQKVPLLTLINNIHDHIKWLNQSIENIFYIHKIILSNIMGMSRTAKWHKWQLFIQQVCWMWMLTKCPSSAVWSVRTLDHLSIFNVEGSIQSKCLRDGLVLIITSLWRPLQAQ